MTASTRRAALGAILAAPLASVPAVAADPHVSREAQARALYCRHRDTEWGWGSPNFSPACEAASEAHGAVMHYANEACTLPPPTTFAGLGVLALSIALSEEQAYSDASCVDADELMLMALVQAVLSLTGTALPPDYRGFCYHPQDDVACT
ncbi:hypothetical protein [Methylobacterium sp. GC_Met_2]|uniref:hypothetical protein n=1 Tax=Methylobacterium sp. GC_Met_2 TaxID=2937376 RepID=UPI00226B4DFD|nr:hypothetical protein [Methylobacterium sp. GC_Met_2]